MADEIATNTIKVDVLFFAFAREVTKVKSRNMS